MRSDHSQRILASLVHISQGFIEEKSCRVSIHGKAFKHPFYGECTSKKYIAALKQGGQGSQAKTTLPRRTTLEFTEAENDLDSADYCFSSCALTITDISATVLEPDVPQPIDIDIEKSDTCLSKYMIKIV